MNRLLLAAVAVLALACSGGRPKPSPLPAGVSFAGTWDSTWGKMILRQEGAKIAGQFSGYREGGLSGRHEGDLFKFIWDQRMPRQHGRGYMQLSPDGLHLEGRWGYDEDDMHGGRWAADRDTTP